MKIPDIRARSLGLWTTMCQPGPLLPKTGRFKCKAGHNGYLPESELCRNISKTIQFGNVRLVLEVRERSLPRAPHVGFNCFPPHERLKPTPRVASETPLASQRLPG